MASTVLTIAEAFPCKSITTGDDETNVEMDPASELEVRKLISSKNLSVVGWCVVLRLALTYYR